MIFAGRWGTHYDQGLFEWPETAETVEQAAHSPEVNEDGLSPGVSEYWLIPYGGEPALLELDDAARD